MKVTNVCPGPVETNFNISSFGEEKAAEVFGGARDYDRLTAEEVAKAILGAASVADNVQVVYLGFLKECKFSHWLSTLGGRNRGYPEGLLQEELMFGYLFV